MRLEKFLVTGMLTSVFVLGIYAMFHWLGIPAGAFQDWVIGLLSAWWLLVVTTFPWNIHFRAREVIVEAEESQRKGHDPLRQDQLVFAQRLASRSFFGAILLHLVSALVLFGLSWLGISSIGFYGCVAALLLTGLRPLLRYTQYVISRLNGISEDVRYPKEDVWKLKNDLELLKEKMRALDLEEPDSWASQQEQRLAELNHRLTHLRDQVEAGQLSNQAEHLALSKRSEEMVAQITEDGQFLNHAREVIRFFKNA